MLKYLEIDSTYRNRQDFPNPANFDVLLAQSGTRFTSITSHDPIAPIVTYVPSTISSVIATSVQQSQTNSSNDFLNFEFIIYIYIIKKMANVVCIKVSDLRKLGYTDLEHWMQDPNNLYTGRRGRIFITDPNKPKEPGVNPRIFNYPASKWKNPYKVGPKDYTLNTSLILYVLYLFKTGLIYEIDELEGKNLGCFCEKPPCHAKVLVDLLGKCKHLIPPRPSN